MAAGLSQFQYIIIILIFGSKVLLLAKMCSLGSSQDQVLFIPKLFWDKTCCKPNFLQRLPFTD